MRNATTAFAIAVAGAVGWFGHMALATEEQPHCPEEDSCYPNYDGWTSTWTIVEGTPPWAE